MEKLKLKVILGSTREGRKGAIVFDWLKKALPASPDFETEFLDLRDYSVPYYDYPGPASQIADPAVKRWGAKIADGDAFIMITPEYNHGYTAVLKNAIDVLKGEWMKKPVAFVSYSMGPLAGARAVEQLRQVVIEMHMAPIRDAIHIPNLGQAFGKDGAPADEYLPKYLDILLEQLKWWALALKEGREKTR
jgi:NAD(P)H-dependent FMN reductase